MNSLAERGSVRGGENEYYSLNDLTESLKQIIARDRRDIIRIRGASILDCEMLRRLANKCTLK